MSTEKFDLRDYAAGQCGVCNTDVWSFGGRIEHAHNTPPGCAPHEATLLKPTVPVSAPTPAAEEDGFVSGKMPKRPGLLVVPNHGSGLSAYCHAHEARAYADACEALIRTLTAERDAGVEKGIRMAAEAVKSWCNAEFSVEFAGEVGSELETALLALIPQPEEVKHGK